MEKLYALEKIYQNLISLKLILIIQELMLENGENISGLIYIIASIFSMLGLFYVLCKVFEKNLIFVKYKLFHV